MPGVGSFQIFPSPWLGKRSTYDIWPNGSDVRSACGFLRASPGKGELFTRIVQVVLGVVVAILGLRFVLELLDYARPRWLGSSAAMGSFLIILIATRDNDGIVSLLPKPHLALGSWWNCVPKHSA